MRVGLAIGRFQPLHIGHCRKIHQMMQDCDTVIAALGSTQESGTIRNPFTQDQRKQMIKNVYGDKSRVKIVPVSDINSLPTTNSWIDYVHQKVTSVGLPEPTDYYTGRDADSQFYKGRYWPGMVTDILSLKDGTEIPTELKEKYQIKGDPIKDDYFTSDGVLRTLHVIGTGVGFMDIRSATEIRSYLQHGDASWKQFIPRINHEFVKNNFPDDLKITKW